MLDRFQKNWLAYGYSDWSKIEQDHHIGLLSSEETDVLRKVHLHNQISLVDKPSELDIQLLKGLYYGMLDVMCVMNYWLVIL